MTVNQVLKALEQHKYVALRSVHGWVIGVNCKVGKLGKNNRHFSGTQTEYISYEPISFQEYISIKQPFIKPLTP